VGLPDRVLHCGISAPSADGFMAEMDDDPKGSGWAGIQRHKHLKYHNILVSMSTLCLIHECEKRRLPSIDTVVHQPYSQLHAVIHETENRMRAVGVHGCTSLPVARIQQ
jgi:hypothetical protein